MKYQFTLEQKQDVYNLLTKLSEKEDEHFTYYWEDNTDYGYVTHLLAALFDLDTEDESMDWDGAFLDILIDHDYPEMDITLLEYCGFYDEAKMLVKMWINDNYDSLKETFEEYLAEQE